MTYVRGYKLRGKVRSLLSSAIKELYGSGANVEFAVVAIPEGSEEPCDVDVYVQCTEPIYNEYGAYLATQRWWVTLSSLAERLGERATKLSKIKEIVERVKAELSA